MKIFKIFVMFLYDSFIFFLDVSFSAFGNMVLRRKNCSPVFGNHMFRWVMSGLSYQICYTVVSLWIELLYLFRKQ